MVQSDVLWERITSLIDFSFDRGANTSDLDRFRKVVFKARELRIGQ